MAMASFPIFSAQTLEVGSVAENLTAPLYTKPLDTKTKQTPRQRAHGLLLPPDFTPTACLKATK
jgi:hypothetical protein